MKKLYLQPGSEKNMKIIFWGSSHGVPTAERNCSCAMLEVNDSIYFIDAGAPIVEEILKRDKDINKVRAVFTTHCHGDHTSGLFNVASLVDWYFKSASIAFYLTDEEIKKLVEDYMRVTAYKQPTFDNVRLLIAKEGLVYQDENIRVYYVLTKHPIHKVGDSPSYAILVEVEEKKILFSGDLSGNIAEDDFPQIALKEPIDAMVLEFAHFNYEDVQSYLKKCMAKQLWFNHIYPLSKIDVINAVRAEYPYPIYIAEDGDVIEL